MKKPLLLMILDGFGIGNAYGNAILAAHTPNLDRIFARNPHTQIHTSGLHVGLPDGQMGNSEVGHTNIGAGRIVYQELTRITKAIDDGDFFQNPALLQAVQHAGQHQKALHIMGLLSDGGVHSHIDHLYALLKLAKQNGLTRVYIHAFLDGRDVSPTSGIDYVRQLQRKIAELGVGEIATLCGRYFAMDRDNRWERVAQCYDAMVNGIGKVQNDPVAAVEDSYKQGVTDEFLQPVICAEQGQMSSGDSVVFFNFRPDRAREITRTLTDPDFDRFTRKKGFLPLTFVCMTQYDAQMPNVLTAFAPQELTNTLGQYLADLGKTQLRIAETEKYAHVTFFFNGGTETPFAGETRILVDSPKVATYDLLPEMSAYTVTERLLEQLQNNPYDVIVLNFANCVMVGHTGVFEAAVKAVEAVDTCVGRLTDRVTELGGVTMITADHGNADQMLAENGAPFTAHTTNPVPFCVVNYPCKLREDGCLADIAPTMLKVMGLPQPEEMTGSSLIV